jgi:DNA-binding NarL/FixJ family response regulator
VTVPVAVIDPLPVFQHGIDAILSKQGYAVHAPTDVLTWVRERRHSLVLVTVHDDGDWEVLDALCRLKPPPLVIAVTEDDSGSCGARAVQMGARSVLRRQAVARSVERAVIATIEGDAVMPAAVAATLSAFAVLVRPRQAPLSARQISWLRDLSEGRTVAALAKDAGYSERAMYRMLRAAYERLGARSRVEAIMRAKEEGWLTAEPDIGQ